MSSSNYEAVIGIEVHVQLKTESKIFCSCSTEFGKGDNENTCPVCVGMPGSLPVLNDKAKTFAVKAGLALNCEVGQDSVFSRKNYFYPDLPKGYQISQNDKPICGRGSLEVLLDNGTKKIIGITRAHLEEDAGKSTHHGDYTLINLNRAGVPLLEIVSDPDLRSPHEAAQYVRTIRSIVQCIGVCDGNLEEGSLRADCNISIRPKGQEKLGTKVELKNLNSFRFIEKALEYEIDRQIDLAISGELEKIVQETRLYDSDKNRTYSMRLKEEAHDYRYFPEPDILVCKVDQALVEKLKSEMPELPNARSERFQKEYKLAEHGTAMITQQKELADYFEELVEFGASPRNSLNWVITDLTRVLKEDKLDITQTKISSKNLSELLLLVESDKISGKVAKSVFDEMWISGKTAAAIVESKGLTQISDESEIEAIVDEIIENSRKQVEEYRAGKEKLFAYFVGQSMKKSRGKANPDVVTKLLKQKL